MSSTPSSSAGSSAGSAVAVADVEAPSDDLRRGLVEALRSELGDALVGEHLRAGDDVWVRVSLTSWRAAAEAAKGRLGCDYFCFLSAMDWMPSPYGRGEDDPTAEPRERSTEVRQGYAGGDSRLQLMARLYSTARHVGITLKADLDDAEPVAETWTRVYAGANWHERETYEMFGIGFAGHPDLHNLYLPGDFEGHPLRKDFPLLARSVKPWPGIVDVEPMPPGMDGDGEAEPAADAAAEGDAPA